MTFPLHFKKFNDKVKQMNQSRSKELRLSADEARNLHTELFNLLTDHQSAHSLKTPDRKIIPPDLDFF